MTTGPAMIATLLASEREILAALTRRRRDLERYQFLVTAVRDRDVSGCAEYQRTFNGLYMVRRNAAWRSAFYRLLEAQKAASAVHFPTILDGLFSATGRVEASFASKLAATLDPTLPIYDSIVRENLALPLRAGSPEQKIAALCGDYTTIQTAYAEMISSSPFERLTAAFDSAFPEFSTFTRIKKLDFMIWQTRDGIGDGPT